MKKLFFLIITIGFIALGCKTPKNTVNVNLYQLQRIETTAFSDYFYFEFLCNGQVYKVIETKSNDKIEKESLYCKLKKNKYYKIELKTIYELPSKDTNIVGLDLRKIHFVGKKRGIVVGGPRQSVYQIKELNGVFLPCSLSGSVSN